MQASRWFAVGQADGSDPRPGARAADQALAGPDAKLVLVFCSESLDLTGTLRQSAPAPATYP